MVMPEKVRLGEILVQQKRSGRKLGRMFTIAIPNQPKALVQKR